MIFSRLKKRGVNRGEVIFPEEKSKEESSLSPLTEPAACLSEA